MKLFSNTISLLEKSIDYSSIKQKVISQNIANADTPNYKAKSVSFKNILNGEMDKSLTSYITNERHIPFQATTTSKKFIQTTEKDVQFNHNGNSVDMDKEMAEMASNQIYYNALIERLNGKFRTLESVIRGGK